MLAAAGVFIVPRISIVDGKLSFNTQKKRDDKQEEILTAVKTNHDAIQEIKITDREQSMHIKQLQILSAIHNTPNERRLIDQMYDSYKELGGNSYIDTVVAEWRVRCQKA